MEIIDQAAEIFAEIFISSPSHVGVAPGRVEVLGNHTDYNDGFILSAAIDRYVAICGRAIGGDVAKIYSAAFGQTAEFSVLSPQKNSNPQNSWVDYVAGIVDQLVRRNVKIPAFEAVIVSNVPTGVGLSSSAALEVSTAFFLQALVGFSFDKITMAQLAQAAENQFVGMPCGLLDQFSSVMGQQNGLIFLDCRNPRDFIIAPLPHGVALALANTRAKHSLVDGRYSALRIHCFAAAQFFAEQIPSRKITHLRDVSPADFAAYATALPCADRCRAEHVINENARVLAGLHALQNGDVKTLGDCMNESHRSSRDLFGNSCRELDLMFDCASSIRGLFGRRLSGGGFGGCTVNLISADEAESFAAELAEKYKMASGIEPEIYLCAAADGASGLAL